MEKTISQQRNLTIKVIGIGGGGVNIIGRMVPDKVQRIELMAADTDQLELQRTRTAHRILLGFSVAKGNGAGSDHELGRRACVESSGEIKRRLEGADMIFILAGMGGGTGTGGAEVVATVAREVGALTVAVVTTPFAMEGLEKLKRAETGIKNLREKVDSLIVIQSDRLLSVIGDRSVIASLDYVNEMVIQAVRALTNLMTLPALFKLNFADVKKVLANKGLAVFSTARVQGENQTTRAAKLAVISPLVNFKVHDAEQAIVSVIGNDSISLNDVHEAVATVRGVLGERANIVFGVAIDPNLKDELILSVIVTGINATVALTGPNKKNTIVKKALKMSLKKD